MKSMKLMLVVFATIALSGAAYAAPPPSALSAAIASKMTTAKTEKIIAAPSADAVITSAVACATMAGASCTLSGGAEQLVLVGAYMKPVGRAADKMGINADGGAVDCWAFT